MHVLALLFVSLLLSQGTVADDVRPNEQQALLEIDGHLAELAVLIEAAESSADPDARIRFRYDWLRRDVATVRAGVQAHIHRPLTEQRSRTELLGDYQR